MCSQSCIKAGVPDLLDVPSFTMGDDLPEFILAQVGSMRVCVTLLAEGYQVLGCIRTAALTG